MTLPTRPLGITGTHEARAALGARRTGAIVAWLGARDAPARR